MGMTEAKASRLESTGCAARAAAGAPDKGIEIWQRCRVGPEEMTMLIFQVVFGDLVKFQDLPRLTLWPRALSFLPRTSAMFLKY